MIALLRKDWRVYRATVIGSLIIVLAPYLLVAIADYISPPRKYYRGQYNDQIIGAAMFGLWLTAMIAVAFGGAAFAQERRERSADFLGMLPVKRTQILASKIIVAGGSLAALWLVNFAVILIAAYLDVSQPMLLRGDSGLVASISTSATAMMMFFGVAWMLSTFLSSPTISAIVSLGATATLMALVALLVERENAGMSRPEELVRVLIEWLTASVGLVTFLAGTIYYLGRVEP